MNDVYIRKIGVVDNDLIQTEVDGLPDDNSTLRMGVAAGRYAQQVGKERSMKARAVRVGDADYDHGYGVWRATYRVEVTHLPMDEMFAQMRANEAANDDKEP